MWDTDDEFKILIFTAGIVENAVGVFFPVRADSGLACCVIRSPLRYGCVNG